MTTIYTFYPPQYPPFTKEFPDDNAALRWASESDDTAASTGVSRQLECHWSDSLGCFVPVEAEAKFQSVKANLEEEITRLQQIAMGLITKRKSGRYQEKKPKTVGKTRTVNNKTY